MRIVSVETFPVPPRWLFVKVSTDAGIAGWGEATLEGRLRAVAGAVQELSGYLVGQDPSRILDTWEVLFRGGFYRGGAVLMSALAGLDQALWDIKGRQLNVPVYELLGGPVRQRIQVYSWIQGREPQELAEEALARVAEGFRAVKMTVVDRFGRIESPAAVKEALRRAEAVREAVGDGVSIAIDFHGRVNKTMAKVLLRELEPLRPLFVEEPVAPEDSDLLVHLAHSTTIPIATGERLYSRWDFKPLLVADAIDVAQPDLSHAGGLTEALRIAALAETFDVLVAPHCPLGPIALAACLQLDAVAPNFLIQEQSLRIEYHGGNELLEYLVDPGVFRFRDGYVELPSRPGLGIEVNEAKVREVSRKGVEWHNPVWRLDDGSLCEW